MIRNVNKLLSLLIILPVLVYAGTITGKITNAKTGAGLAGANVMIEGTQLGAAADADGSYRISSVPDGTYNVKVQVIGYATVSKAVEISGSTKLDFQLRETALRLSEVTVAGNFANERETPVAFTTVSEEHIKNNFTVQDVPHLFANTPGVYVTSDGGSGMGDSKVQIRGFDEQRIAVMINNVPVNDPESKKVYWSNWGSLPAASQSIQIQRGVGSSLYGSGALGGSINVVTKDAPAEKSLAFSSTMGQYGILKLGIDYNSGLILGNKSIIARFNYLEGNGWRDDTFYRGLQYYFSAMVFPNESNTFKFILHGAPQYHAYAYYGFPVEDYAEYGREWNGHPHIDEDEITGVFNSRFDEGEDYIDTGYTDEDGNFISGGNGIWDENEEFSDAGNGVWDEGEDWTDEVNGIWDEGEDWTDVVNGIWDEGEEFFDAGNGVWDEGEEWIDELNGVWDEGEEFFDENLNGIYDEGEEFFDAGNGVWDEGEEWIDELNGVWDEGEEWTDELNGVWDEGEEWIDELNGVWDEGEEWTDNLLNGVYDEGEEFTDTGYIDEDGNYVEGGNGQYDEGENFTDIRSRNMSDRETKLADVLFMKTKIGNSKQGGLVVGNGRASFDNNVYHKPQFEIHHSFQISETSKLTSTFFVSKGYGYGENLNKYYYVDRDSTGLMTYDAIMNGGSSVYQYRAYSDHFQTGLLSSLETKMGDHEFTTGIEFRYWKARHAGEMLNLFDKDRVSSYIGNTIQYFEEGELYYDYEGIKPQVTIFGHALWKFDKFNLMTDIQFSTIDYNIIEAVPNNNNYPNHLDPDATTHGGDIWTGTATWDDDDGALYDDDDDPATPDVETPEVPVEYTLWDYEKRFYFASPKVGINYNIDEFINVFSNYSRAVNEPRVKYFFGYGSPNDALDLEETQDIELGLSFDGISNDGIPISAKVNWYNIDFTGKALKITDPEKANTPGYDYKGRKYIPIGDSKYTGIELSFNTIMLHNLEFGFNLSVATNEWGEPEDSEGAQFLYSNADVVAGVDYEDLDSSGTWDAGEIAMHTEFTKKFGNRVEVGMPQLIYGGTLNWNMGPVILGLAMRHYEDIYVLENNNKITVDGHFDEDDEWVVDKKSATLPEANVFDLVIRYNIPIMSGLNMSLHINNILDEEYWQSGDNYGVKPGAARTTVFNLGLTL